MKYLRIKHLLVAILSSWQLQQTCCESRIQNGCWGMPACMATSRRGRRFAKSTPAKKDISTDSIKPAASSGRKIYSMPALYDLAFGYRSYDEEVEFLIGQHQSLQEDGKTPCRVLELAAGPARHCIYALQSSKVASATALDNSIEMMEYSTEIAARELDVDTFESSFHYLNKDMCNFEFGNERKFDSAWILLGSLAHLTTNEQVISCLKSVHEVLVEKGTLILELPHPRETFSLGECTRNGWTVPLEDDNGNPYGKLEIIWGDDNDEFDPITQVRQFTVAMQLKNDEEDPSKQQHDMQLQNGVKEVVPMRLFTAQEIQALAHIAGFKTKELHGALDPDGVNVNDENEAFRLVCTLCKI